MSTGTFMGVMAAFALLVFVGIPTLMWVWEDSYRDPNYPGVETTIQVRVNKAAEGDWLLSIVSGSKPASLTLQVVNRTNEIVFIKTLASIKIPASDPDAAFTDTDGNNKVNAGDTILLKASGGLVKAGQRVQLLWGNSLVGVVKSLP